MEKAAHRRGQLRGLMIGLPILAVLLYWALQGDAPAFEASQCLAAMEWHLVAMEAAQDPGNVTAHGQAAQAYANAAYAGSKCPGWVPP